MWVEQCHKPPMTGGWPIKTVIWGMVYGIVLPTSYVLRLCDFYCCLGYWTNVEKQLQAPQEGAKQVLATWSNYNAGSQYVLAIVWTPEEYPKSWVLETLVCTYFDGCNLADYHCMWPKPQKWWWVPCKGGNQKCNKYCCAFDWATSPGKLNREDGFSQVHNVINCNQ